METMKKVSFTKVTVFYFLTQTKCSFCGLCAGRLAGKIARKDSLALKLAQRPIRQELIERNILPSISDQERQATRELLENKLSRRLSLRPTVEELEQRNILRVQSPEEFQQEKEQRKINLNRKVRLLFNL
jgi:phosphatase and actin regulator 3